MSARAKRLLLIGGTGFVGQHMIQIFAGHYSIIAVGREVDIRDLSALERIIAKSKPDFVVNLAAITTVRESFEKPVETYETAFIGTLNLLRALRASGFSGKVLYISSSEVYGHPFSAELPLTESSPLMPMSPYSVAKLSTEFLCQQWVRSEGMEILIARPFTHIGPGQSERFAISNFSRQIAEIKLGFREPILLVGDLLPTRDITDVRDVARAYKLILERGAPGEIYNVCSGIEISMQEVLKQLLSLVDCQVRIEIDGLLTRKSEQQRLCGSYEKLHIQMGWRPTVSLVNTLSDSFQYWMKTLSLKKEKNAFNL